MPVVAAALAVGFLIVPLLMRVDRPYLHLCLALMAVECVVGLVGEGMHLWVDFHGSSPRLWDNLIYGAPTFAPMLFPNLALLASIGLWAIVAKAPAGAGGAS